MKKLFKVLAIILVIAMLFTVSACGKKVEESYGAYILSDKGTYLSHKNNPEGDKIPNLTLIYEKDDNMKNTYSMIAVDGDGTGFSTPIELNELGADCFIKWMSLSSTRDIIKAYGINEGFGEALFYLLDSAEIYTGSVDSLKYDGSASSTNIIKISTTTSVNDTGLLGFLEEKFEKETGWDMQVASAGTGAAINAAKQGNADLLLVHSKSQETDFVNAGYARIVEGFKAERISFMYNFFVLIGPNQDPANAKNCSSAAEAFKAIKEGGFSFVSRGDNSGTHTKEISLWGLAGENEITYDKEAGSAKYPESYTWYTSTGSGMGASLQVANETISKK